MGYCGRCRENKEFVLFLAQYNGSYISNLALYNCSTCGEKRVLDNGVADDLDVNSLTRIINTN